MFATTKSNQTRKKNTKISFMVMHNAHVFYSMKMPLHSVHFLVIYMQNEFLIVNANVRDLRSIKKNDEEKINDRFQCHFIRFSVATFLNQFCRYILYWVGSEMSEINRNTATSHHSFDQFILILFHIIFVVAKILSIHR